MPTKRITLTHDMDSRLYLNGGRDQIPANSLRRAVGIAPELSRSVRTRWNSTGLYTINASSLYRYNGSRYQYDGTNLYKDGIVLVTGFNGDPFLNFVTMPPQQGLQDYLFISGGGKFIKIDPSGNVTNWGIKAPATGMAATIGTQDTLTIDNFDTSAGNWSTHQCSVQNESTIVYDGTGAMRIHSPALGPWFITRTLSLNMEQYANTDWSLQSDLISIWMNFSHPERTVWLWILFDIGDGTFLHDYYRLVVQLVPTTTNFHAAGAQLFVAPNPNQWTQVAAAKSVFQRVGTDQSLDWSNVKKIRIEGGNPNATNNFIYVDLFDMYGGFPLGAGPQATTGGSRYQYAVTFGNSTTGSDSNPIGMQTQVDGTTAPFSPVPINGVALESVILTGIPVSSDTQVTNRKLWRTTAGGSIFTFLDIIPDNTTTTYTDVKADLPGTPFVVTPWTKNTIVPANDRVDGLNGFWFKTTGGGTTGGTIPNWNLPTGPFLGDWSPIPTYSINEWVNKAGVGYVAIAENQNSAPPSANWAALGTTTDNTVTWAWGGINAVPALGDQTLLFDNAPPQATFGWAAGPFLGSMLWTGDSQSGHRGWLYISPPGRPESVGQFAAISSDDDPTQAVVLWDNIPWLFTAKHVYQINAAYPAITGVLVKDAIGTELPFTCVGGTLGIYYQSPDGIRIVDWSGSALAGFDNISPIQRGQAVENYVPFTAVWSAKAREEIFFSDNTNVWALGFQNGSFVWRVLGVPLTAAFFEFETGEIIAAYSGGVFIYENFGVT